MLNAKENLIAARELLSDPAHWTRGTYSKNNLGETVVSPFDPETTCWCITGALWKTSGVDSNAFEGSDLGVPGVFNLLSVLDSKRMETLFKFNDHRTHAEILELLDRAIANA